MKKLICLIMVAAVSSLLGCSTTANKTDSSTPNTKNTQAYQTESEDKYGEKSDEEKRLEKIEALNAAAGEYKCVSISTYKNDLGISPESIDQSYYNDTPVINGDKLKFMGDTYTLDGELVSYIHGDKTVYKDGTYVFRGEAVLGEDKDLAYRFWTMESGYKGQHSTNHLYTDEDFEGPVIIFLQPKGVQVFSEKTDKDRLFIYVSSKGTTDMFIRIEYERV